MRRICRGLQSLWGRPNGLQRKNSIIVWKIIIFSTWCRYCCTNDKRADEFRHGSPIIYHKHYGQPMFARDSRIIATDNIIVCRQCAWYDDVPARLTGQVRYVYTSCKRIWNRHIINVPTYIIIICILIEVNNIILSCRVYQDIFSRTRVRPTFGRFIGRTFFISRVPLLYISHIIILYRQRTVFVLHYSTWFTDLS